jgi:NAD+ synthase
MPFTSLDIDPAAAADAIARTIGRQVADTLRRRGAVVALSGGVDSSVCAGLAVRALGRARVLGLAMPERESDPRSLALARAWARRLGIELVVEDVTAVLEAFGCYRRRDDAVRTVVPEFGPGWGMKVVLPELEGGRLNVTRMVVRAPDGAERTVRLTGGVYREIVAAGSFKQRTRKAMEYFHADRLHYAVVGTPNRLEYDQGFFVKGGDGLADLKPIAHLYKTQVYALARYLGVPRGILDRPPTTDTYSLPQTQEEFYFALPAATLDVLLYARNRGVAPVEAALRAGVRPAQAEAAYHDIDRKRAATRPLHLTSLLVEPVPEVAGEGEGG